MPSQVYGPEHLLRLFVLNNTKVLELWYHAIVKIAKTADMKRYNRGNRAIYLL
ncbi:hypothetical protein OS493_030705 [Desmophyllum pertusum]|uniref:Uncharacterized protein n=1 Tax=Desmophyllum pertusum TaxID=174260 RepID=A0A9W9Z978_9CNID|nr:hypothetical protein OS493_030705 [Desmophyllum pertusum]